MSHNEPTGSQDEIQAHLAQAGANRRRNLIIGGVVGVVVIALLAYFFVFDGGAGDDDDLVKLKIGDTGQSDYQDAMVDVGKENGLDLEFVNFQDPFLPNAALAEGEIDANAFQHVAFLSQFNMEAGEEITPLFSMFISTWGLFSAQHDSVEDLPDGARIAVPSDPSNLARALFILQDAGLIELADDAPVFPTEEHIAANPRDIELVQLSHEATHTAYEDPSIDGVIDGLDEFDPKLGIQPEDALQLQDVSAPGASPYIIVAATTPDRLDDPEWELLEKTWRDPRVLEALEEEKAGQATEVNAPVADLRAALEELMNS
jgi:D-methionine transport system substrate-binding protein